MCYLRKVVSTRVINRKYFPHGWQKRRFCPFEAGGPKLGADNRHSRSEPSSATDLSGSRTPSPFYHRNAIPQETRNKDIFDPPVTTLTDGSDNMPPINAIDGMCPDQAPNLLTVGSSKEEFATAIELDFLHRANSDTYSPRRKTVRKPIFNKHPAHTKA
ncbi:hypothetical protein CRG98_029591 [Punica granatum]|uniref:Uncharacterized protein n=1 Tax=Punica granatum TaxID=22663 RepID=A0A2I0J186_PUNGR|nr:hypothetical protein CRG98_029591 [Punica granatum]